MLLCAHPALAPRGRGGAHAAAGAGRGRPRTSPGCSWSPRPTMAARLTRARKRLAGEQFDVPDRRRARRPAGAGRRRRLPRVHRRLRARLGRRRAPARAGRPRRSGWPGCCASSLPGRTRARRAARPDAAPALAARRPGRATGGWCCCPTRTARRWHADEIAEALALLTPLGARPGDAVPPPGADRRRARRSPRRAADTDWPRIAARYGELEDVTGSPVVRLNRAVAVAEADGPLAGLALLDGLELPGHRLPAVRGQLLLRLGRDDEARAELAARPRRVRQRGRARRTAPTRSTGRPPRPDEYADAGAAAAAGSTMRT